MASGALYVTMILAHAKPIQRAVPWATLVPNVTQVHDVKANIEVSFIFVAYFESSQFLRLFDF